MAHKLGPDPGLPAGAATVPEPPAAPSEAAQLVSSQGFAAEPPGAGARVALIAQSAQSAEAVRPIAARLQGISGIALVTWLASEDSLARLASEAPSAVLVDASTSQARALELLRILRRSREAASVPILLLCHKVTQELQATALALGASDCLTYDSDATELVARLRYHIRRAQELHEVHKGRSELAVPAQHAIKVLMIDESKVACQIVARVFAGHPEMQLTACTEPERALALADELLPTVILQSLVMRSADAFELLAALRRNLATRDVPIILLSGVADPAQKARALAAGADDYVVKSKDMAELLLRVRHHSAGYFNLLKGRLAGSTTGAPETDEAEAARVLMIDDSKFFCAAIAQLLASEPHIRFAACTDPFAALATARTFRPTVILQDLEMPQLGGLELLQMLRGDPGTRDIPIIVLSGTTEAATKARVFAEGANDYVEKQMDKIELVSRIRYHSRGYRNAIRLGESIQKLFEIQKRLEIQGEFIRKTFGRYLSDEVVSSLLASPEGLKLGGEKRRITLMMADLRGFTSLSERLPPESVLAIINNYLKVMTGILLSYGATIDEFIGDAILAVFGAPRLQEDDAPRAVACAVEMQLAMQGVNDANQKEGYPAVRMGIGIHTGEVVVGNIGSEKRAKYGVVGKNVNLTSRIESYTLGGQILISEPTRRACGELLRIDSVKEVLPKGVQEPIQVFEVGGIAGRFQRFLPAKETSRLQPLPAPLPLRFVVFEDKHGAAHDHAAMLVAVAEGAGAVAISVAVTGVGGDALAPLTNLKLTLFAAEGREITRELYGKVTGRAEAAPGAVRVELTSVPPEAAAFLSALRERVQGA
ncbi:MAG: response regulator [Polyangia bacterium]